MEDLWITIEREYRSGGTAVARELSEKTGIPCYGREILEEVSKDQGVDIDLIQNYEETASSPLSYTLFSLSRSSTDTDGSVELLTQEDKVFIAEQEAIRRLAAKGSAIFLGHCASEALRNRSKVVKVFIKCSDEDSKYERIQKDYGIAASKVLTTARRYDKKRANYYRVNTGRRWNDADNYDIILDTARLGVDGCAKVLKGLYAD